MKPLFIYSEPECNVVLIKHGIPICTSYNVNSLNDYNHSDFDDEDWD